MQVFVKETKHQVIQFYGTMHQKLFVPRKVKKLTIVSETHKNSKLNCGSCSELTIVSSTS